MRTSGYGTKGRAGETITREEAEKRLRDEFGKAGEAVAFQNVSHGRHPERLHLETSRFRGAAKPHSRPIEKKKFAGRY
jgi:hypothetical protein